MIAELVFIVLEYRDGVQKLARSVIRPPERPSRGRLALELAATALIVLGVAGQLGIGGKIALIKGKLHGANAELRSTGDQLVSRLNVDVGKANE